MGYPPQALAAKFDIFDGFREFMPWLSLDGFNVGGDTGYDCYVMGAALWMMTGGAANDDVYIYSFTEWSRLEVPGKKVTVEFIILSVDAIDENVWLRFGGDATDPPSEIVDHFGFKIIGADLYASNADGANQTITDTGVDISLGMQRTRLKVVLDPGTDCKFYVNDSLVATHETNLPDNRDYLLHIHIRSLEAGGYISANLGRVLIEKEN